MIELGELFKAFSKSPELALLALVLTLITFAVRKIFTIGFRLLGKHLENIDENFQKIATDISGLRNDVIKIADKLENHAELVQDKIDDLDRRVTRLEDKD